MGTRSPRANRPSRPSTFLTARPDSLIQTSSCLWFLFSTSETEAEPLVWSLNKLELKLPEQGNWERCTVSAEAVARGTPAEEWHFPQAWETGSPSFGSLALETPGCGLGQRGCLRGA